MSSDSKDHFFVTGFRHQILRVRCGTSLEELKTGIYHLWGVPVYAQAFDFLDEPHLGPGATLVLRPRRYSSRKPKTSDKYREFRASLKKPAPAIQSGQSQHGPNQYEVFGHSAAGYFYKYVCSQTTVGDWKLWWANRTGMPTHMQRWIFAGQALKDDTATFESLRVHNMSTLHLSYPLRGDIGIFQYPSDEIVKAMNIYTFAEKTDFDDPTQRHNSNTMSYKWSFRPILSVQQCLALIEKIDQLADQGKSGFKDQDNKDGYDVQHDWTLSELQDVIPLPDFGNFPPFTIIRTRRVTASQSADPRAIDFHTDVSLDTVSIALNNDYEGGDMMYQVGDKYHHIHPRVPGDVLIHNNRIRHAVTPLLRGRRYHLFFLNQPNLPS